MSLVYKQNNCKDAECIVMACLYKGYCNWVFGKHFQTSIKLDLSSNHFIASIIQNFSMLLLFVKYTLPTFSLLNLSLKVIPITKHQSVFSTFP